MTAPSTTIAEWWRGRTDRRESVLAAIDVEPVSLTLARLAGEAMARVRGAILADAIVMASAAAVTASSPVTCATSRNSGPTSRP